MNKILNMKDGFGVYRPWFRILTVYFMFNDCSGALLNIDFYTKKYNRIHVLFFKNKLELTNCYGGDIKPALNHGIYWSHFWKHGFRFL